MSVVIYDNVHDMETTFRFYKQPKAYKTAVFRASLIFQSRFQDDLSNIT